MIRLLCMAFLAALSACSDQSRGAALNECRMQYYLIDPTSQAQLIPECMRSKSFQSIAECNPEPYDPDWDRLIRPSTFVNPQCYRPVGAQPWLATALSPM
jgi:hypothetical protein